MRTFWTILISAALCACSGEEIEEQEKGPDIIINKAPGTPILIFPEKDQLCLDPVIAFTWHRTTDPDGDQVSYNLQLSSDPSFGVLIRDLNTRDTTTTMNLDPAADYYWRVAAYDDSGEKGSFAQYQAFTVEGNPESNHVPNSPTLVSPYLNASVAPGSQTLSWDAVDADNEVLTFDIYFGTTNPPQLYVADHGANTLGVTTEAGKTYFWKVHAKDQSSLSIGNTWTFSTSE
ncbi:fibronectin type III domain-containing protein [Robertkochia flava]|uniref:fibronectin type III domain-containing protein n=1 Tax=Robertkochia flava TaxID=3447986 RepID=UPI001CCCBECF|nr:fibronectin type III domain-containing protein [Robertkochia marina]